ncbi:MAG: ATP-dependent RNA helicase DbpA [Gammaproteobacteria bacterium]|nr:ATP-dependent RNA helicase DbpA [Gammaproteobacteria bacterium]
MSQTAFSSLELHADLLSNLDSLGYTEMTPIQAQSLPAILANRDVIAQAKTGSGKTAAFSLGMLQKLNVKQFRIQSLVLCPTRELADQVAAEIRKLARSIHNIKVLTLCGGAPFGPQAGSLEHGAHIVVGTPGRIEDHLTRGTLSLDDLNMLVLDEADRMLEMGFQAALDAIIAKVPASRQTLLFSATFPAQIKAIADHVMTQPLMVSVAETHDEATIEQHFYSVEGNEQRMMALRLLLQQFRPASSVVFCNTKKECQDIADMLRAQGMSALALHGDLEQRDRDQVLVRFANKSVAILVATDVAARGLDVESLDLVINFHLAHDPETHIHRIGRTGRAGKKGVACSLISEKESYKVARLSDHLGQPINGEALPDKSVLTREPLRAEMVTLQIDGGKKQKIRAGDILGALTNGDGIEGAQIGKIHLYDNWCFVAVANKVAKLAMNKISQGKIKGKSFRARLLPG